MKYLDNLEYQDIERRKEKNKNIKTIKKTISKEQNKQNRGKPKDLGKIKLDLQKVQVWVADETCLKIIGFFLRNGRFLSPHLAGLQKSIDCEKDQKIKAILEQQLIEIKQKKPLYQFIELFSIKYLGMPPNQNQKARLSVFFLRSSQIQVKKTEYTNLDGESDWNKLLKKIYFLLNPKFYQELITILQNFSEGASPLQIFDNILQFQGMRNASQILQVLFLHKIKEEKINYKELERKSNEEIENVFKQTVSNQIEDGTEFLKQLYDLFFNIKQDQNYQSEQQPIFQNQADPDGEFNCDSYYYQFIYKQYEDGGM